MISEKELKLLDKKKNLLEKKDIDLIISDFDDTIFSTKEVIDNDYREGRRGKEGNDYILKNNLINKIITEVYENKKYPNGISSKLRKNHDLILTVGIHEFQLRKIQAANLEHINYKIVNTADEKIIETIKYVIEDLKFIPNKIIIYEDRPKYFIENKKFIEDFLGIKVEIYFVEMIDNDNEPKMTKMEQKKD